MMVTLEKYAGKFIPTENNFSQIYRLNINKILYLKISKSLQIHTNFTRKNFKESRLEYFSLPKYIPK